ncbi:MAG: hypothetical protein ABW031_02255 [Methyloceanibacter sp.]|jgi:hypothetical protein
MLRLMRVNFWQRLWVVGATLSLVAFDLVLPWIWTHSSSLSKWDYRRSIERDFENSQCSRYANDNFASLTEPPHKLEGSTCWHLYTSRKFARMRHGEQVPYTLAVHLENVSKDRREQFYIAAGLGSVVSIILSALVYAVGLAVAWIIRGYGGR